eukprot:1159823-Pelagomonas_calceolata.AAC.4
MHTPLLSPVTLSYSEPSIPAMRPWPPSHAPKRMPRASGAQPAAYCLAPQGLMHKPGRGGRLGWGPCH